jgi:hypothetical protein
LGIALLVVVIRTLLPVILVELSVVLVELSVVLVKVVRVLIEVVGVLVEVVGVLIVLIEIVGILVVLIELAVVLIEVIGIILIEVGIKLAIILVKIVWELIKLRREETAVLLREELIPEPRIAILNLSPQPCGVATAQNDTFKNKSKSNFRRHKKSKFTGKTQSYDQFHDFTSFLNELQASTDSTQLKLSSRNLPKAVCVGHLPHTKNAFLYFAYSRMNSRRYSPLVLVERSYLEPLCLSNNRRGIPK